MNVAEAHRKGYYTGQAIGSENRADFTDKDEFVSACLTHESDTYRQFSPFEFFANEINQSDDPEGLWDAYERGVYHGVEDAW